MKLRVLSFFCLFVFVFFASALGSAQTIINSPNRNNTIPSTYFGIHAWGFEDGHTPWPNAAIGAYRTWDSGVVWSSIERSRGKYDWSQLDSIVSFMQSKHVDVLFTFGRVPRWASSNPHASCGGGPGQCAPPYSMQDWSNFVSALANRYKGRIKYYEVWNEPNASNWWQGSTSQLVALAKTAYSVIKQADPGAKVVAPATQGLYAFQLADAYFAAGGPADIVSFHGYVGFSHGHTQAPEKWINVAQNMFSMMKRHGLNRPLWDTEIGWDFNYHLPNSYDQAAFVSRLYILHWLYGVNRVYWDMYDGSSGTLYHGHLTQAGQAYVTMTHWLVGSSMDQCAQYSNGTWACHLVRPNRHNAWLLWNVNGNNTFRPESSWALHAQSDLSGGTHSISAGNSIAISRLPILVEGGVASANTGGGGGTTSDSGTDFTLSATPTSATVPAGKAAQFQVTLTPAAGFRQTATLSCTGAPAGASCSPSANAVAFDGRSPVAVTFTVSTNGSTLSASVLPGGMALVWLLALLALMPFFLERKRVRDRALRAVVAVFVLALITITLASCGGSPDARTKSSTLTPSNGSYVLVFSGTSGAVTHTTSVTLHVH